MQLPHLTLKGFTDLFREHGWEMASDQFVKDHGRLIFTKEGQPSYPFMLRGDDTYSFYEVVRICLELGMTAPSHCLTPYNQWEAQKKKVSEDLKKRKKELDFNPEKDEVTKDEPIDPDK